MTDNAHRTSIDSPQPDIPYLRRLMADALDGGKIVLIVPPESASFLWEELEIEPEEFSPEGYMEVSEPVTEGHPVYAGLFVHLGSGEHATGASPASDLITGSLTLSEREEDRS